MYREVWRGWAFHLCVTAVGVGLKMQREIVIVSMNRQFSGGERYVTILSKALIRSGYRVSFFGDWLTQFETCAFSRVIEASGRFSSLTAFPSTDVLILNGLRPLYKYLIACLFGGRKSRLVVYVHHVDVSDPHRGRAIARLRPLLMFAALRYVDVTVSINRDPLGFPFKRDATVSILNAIDVDDYECNSVVERSFLNLLCVGSLTYRKNFQLAIRAIQHIPNAKLIIVGAGPELSKLMNISAELRVSERVQFVGQVDDVREYYRQADALLMPSLQEAFGLVAIEAMASCLPVISTPTAGGREILNSDEVGVLLKDFSVEEMVGAINRIQDPGLRQRLALNGRRRVVEKFSLDRFASEWAGLLARAMG